MRSLTALFCDISEHFPQFENPMCKCILKSWQGFRFSTNKKIHIFGNTLV